MTRSFPLAPFSAIALLWFVLIYWLNQDGSFRSNGGPPFVLFPAILLPMLVAAAAYLTFPALRQSVRSMDLAVLIGVQSFRVIGILFLFVWGLGNLPTIFAWVAALGDIAVGLLALHATILIARESPRSRQLAYRVTWAGIADFAVVLALAALSAKGMPLAFEGQPLPIMMQDLPMVLIPTFLVPLWLVFHLAALARLRSPD